MALTYATWNPSDKGSNIVLSGGDLTVSLSSGTWKTVRSTIGVSSGKWYWENTVGGSVIDVLIGVGLAAMPLTSWVGNNSQGYGYYMGGVKYNSSSASYGATYAIGDIIGVALDMDAGTIEMYKNNTSQGVMYTGLSGTFYAAASVDNTTVTWTTNFGATTMAYTAPSGYNQGLYAGTATNVNIFESVTVTENTSFQINTNLSVFDSVTVSENVKISLSLPSPISDSVTVSENLNIRSSSNLNIFDAVSVTENLAFAIISPGINLIVSDTITVIENLSFFLPKLVLSVSDTITTTEQVYLLNGIYEEPMETITLSESVVISVPIPISVFDSILVKEGPVKPGTVGGTFTTAYASPTVMDGTINQTAGPGTAPWTDINNVLLEDGSFATNTVQIGVARYTKYAKATGFGFSIPSDATINGVQVESKMMVNNASQSNWYSALLVVNDVVTGSNLALNTPVGTSLVYKVYGGPTTLWGLSLTPADINSSTFGYVIGAGGVSSGSRIFSLDHMRMSVTYTTASSPDIETPTVEIVTSVSPTETVTVTESFDGAVPYIALEAFDSVSVSEQVGGFVAANEFLEESITVSENIDLVINTDLSVFDSVTVSEQHQEEEVWNISCSETVVVRDWLSIYRPPIAYDAPEYVPFGDTYQINPYGETGLLPSFMDDSASGY